MKWKKLQTILMVSTASFATRLCHVNSVISLEPYNAFIIIVLFINFIAVSKHR